MNTTTTRIRVRVVHEGGRYELRDADTGRRRAIEGSRQEAEAHAAERGWYVVNPHRAEEGA